jgi:general stress protein YciG
MSQESISKKLLEGQEQTALAPEPPPRPAAQVDSTRRLRGFAAMDRDLVRGIARKGGRAAHEAGTAHEFTSEEARVAGRKGGQASRARRREPVEAAQEAEKKELR